MKRKGIKWLSRIAHRVAMKSRTQVNDAGRVREYRQARALVRAKRAALREERAVNATDVYVSFMSGAAR